MCFLFLPGSVEHDEGVGLVEGRLEGVLLQVLDVEVVLLGEGHGGQAEAEEGHTTQELHLRTLDRRLR